MSLFFFFMYLDGSAHEDDDMLLNSNSKMKLGAWGLEPLSRSAQAAFHSCLLRI